MTLPKRPPFPGEFKLTSPRLGSRDNPHYADAIAWVQKHVLNSRQATAKYGKPVEVDGIFGAQTAYEVASLAYRLGRPGPELPAITSEGMMALVRWVEAGGKDLPPAWAAERRKRLLTNSSVWKVGAGISKRTWRLLHPASYPVETPKAALADGLAVAKGWASRGLHEIPAGGNVVPHLAERARALGVAPNIARMGYAWCALNYFLAHLEAGHPVARAGLVAVSFWPLFCPTLDNYARAGQHGLKVVDPGAARPGDAVLFNFDSAPDEDHIGMFDRFDGGNVVTVDGNSSVFGSQSNGGACVVRSRPRSQAVTYFTLTS